MKMLVAGIKRVAGPKGSKSGQPFDFSELYGLTLIECVQKENITVQGYGYEPGKFPVADGAIGSFAAFEARFPMVLDLETDVEAFMGKFETVVTGVRASSVPAPKAA